jgi:superfamily II DNA/RNA helicase
MGKTAVFVITLLHKLENDEKSDPCSALVLCHTRELAYQIKNEFDRFSKYLEHIKTEVIYGGIPINDHINLLKKNPPQIIVGTPGRVYALARQGHLDLKKLKFFVLDECDKMVQDIGKDFLLNFQT